MENNLKKIAQKFQHLREKKILIYGSGINAKCIIRALSEFRIVGVIDRVQFIGEIEGISIKMWDEVHDGDADVIIIAASYRNYKEIYDRIIDKCIAYDIRIFGGNGQNLISHNGIITATKENNEFFSKNEDEVLRKIDNCEAISFDLFDTLIMRKNLEPADLFDLLEKKVNEKGIHIQDLKKYRRQAELLSKGGDIYKIYHILQQITGLSKEECDMILEEEIECERQYIVPREKMVEIMSYAVESGKRVNIITNMYLPEAILKDILKKNGIAGYEKIYVSCEYGLSKGTGLFEKYMEDVKANSYFHIGDDKHEDIESANKYGIDAYEIKSAHDMLKVSNLRHISGYACNSNEKGMIGLLIAELFNDPFVLYGSNGVIRITNCKLFGKIFVAPVVIYYMMNLLDVVYKCKECDGILFGSRDGYLFKRLYDRLNLTDLQKKSEIPSWYFMTSRKLCLKAAMKAEENIRTLKDYSKECGIEEILSRIFHIDDISKYEKKEYPELDLYYLKHKEAIIEKSNRIRENYFNYMQKCGILLDGKYILCDLISQGTVHHSLNQIMNESIFGFYLCRRSGYTNFRLDSFSCYQETEDNVSDIIENNNFLESILTSPEPTIVDMDENGEPVFATEERTPEEIEAVMSVQKGIEDFFFEYINMMFIKEKKITKQIPRYLLRMHKEVFLTDECEILEHRKLFDDLADTYCDM